MRYNLYWTGLIAVTLVFFIKVREKDNTCLFESEYSFSDIESKRKLTANWIEDCSIRRCVWE